MEERLFVPNMSHLKSEKIKSLDVLVPKLKFDMNWCSFEFPFLN